MIADNGYATFIFFVLFLLMFLFAFLFWLYFKKITMKDSTARKIEIVGYFFLCVLVIWEFGVKNILMRGFNNLDTYILEEKLNTMLEWARKVIAGMDYTDVLSNYYKIGTRNQFVEKQLFLVDFVEMILQVLSTIFIAIGRFQELKTKKKNK